MLLNVNFHHIVMTKKEWLAYFCKYANHSQENTTLASYQVHLNKRLPSDENRYL